ncbi:hypothetical protein [Cyclobacterium amurskyense]|uniref:Uncharacterized protein n=1 Tax=Cyclobacterium amurskyense TaxID=320787 RepID=A0A0H4PHP3_9BACT|nr:hypothetical protein [Cyclobacterium amurskyense]AKP52388.1 hypothetical protein CA2015_2983 [Cyclobacterium amurskyense]
MGKLSDNWISEGWVDFEYKKYLLLACLQDVEKDFKSVKLYPPLAELIHHYQKLENLDKTRNELKSGFPKEVDKVDLKKLTITYKDKTNEDEVMKQMGEIISYALPQIKKQIEEGKSIYEFIEGQLEIEPVGLSALYQKEGYALVSNGNSKDILVYRYKIDLFQNSLDKYRGIVLRFVAAFRKSLSNTCNRIKLDLIKNFTDLPNPSTWRIYSKQDVPLQESLLPISKRLLLRNISV